jgi:hypothetical protein
MSASSGHMIMPMSPCKITASVDDRRKTNLELWRDYSALGELLKIAPHDSGKILLLCVRHGCNLTSIDTNYSQNQARPGSNSEAALPSLRGPIRTYLESCL